MHYIGTNKPAVVVLWQHVGTFSHVLSVVRLCCVHTRRVLRQRVPHHPQASSCFVLAQNSRMIVCESDKRRCDEI